MSVFRIEKNRNYTVMSNHHLRNKELSLKSKGLFSLMLSLPEEWDYTLKGLSIICKEGIDAIRVSIIELEKHGYIERRRNRNAKGQLTNTEYIIHEQPIQSEPKSEQPTLENPILDNPTQVEPMLGNPTQINKDKTNKDKLNTDLIKYPSINQRDQTQSDGLMDRYNKNIDLIKNKIEYDTLSLHHDRDVIDEIVRIMAEVLTIDTPYYTIERKLYPSEFVKQRFLEIDYAKLDAFMLEFTKRTDKIRNIKAYLITSLFNAPATADTNLSNMVKHDLYDVGRRRTE